MVSCVVPVERKYTLKWAARGLAYHLMFFNAVFSVRSAGRIISSFPRSGTSWLSELLSNYYGVPCPRHSLRPNFKKDIILHTHLLPPFSKRALFYIERDCEDVYISLFIKRFRFQDKQEIREPTATTLTLFHDFLRREVRAPYESPMMWGDHVTKGRRLTERLGAYIRYDELYTDTVGTLRTALERVDKEVDENRLSSIVARLGPSLRDAGQVFYTSASGARWDHSRWFVGENITLLEQLGAGR